MTIGTPKVLKVHKNSNVSWSRMTSLQRYRQLLATVLQAITGNCCWNISVCLRIDLIYMEF